MQKRLSLGAGPVVPFAGPAARTFPLTPAREPIASPPSRPTQPDPDAGNGGRIITRAKAARNAARYG